MKRLIIAITVTIGLLTVAIPMDKTSALTGSQFKAGRIIDDSLFYNGNSLASSQVQAFLNAKVPSCDTWGTKPSGHAGYPTRADWGRANGAPPPYTCLKSYKQDTPFRAGESGLCSPITAKSNRTAAQIIDDVARACGISQKVIIVLLQKEQSLVTDDWPWPIQYRSATGYGCPDTAACDSTYYGFFNQVYSAARQFKRYRADPTYYNHIAGQNNNVRYHPNAACGSSTVYIQNHATAGLYNYTPYQPNSAALSNLYGTGNSCSSYGNRNFWRIYNEWFGSTEGTPFFALSDGKIYIEGDGKYYYVSSPSMMKSYGYGTTYNKIRSLSSADISGLTYGGVLPHIARFESDEVYIVNQGKLHHITSPELFADYGFTFGQEANLQESMKWTLSTDRPAANVIKVSNINDIYVVESGKKRHITSSEAFTTLGSPAYSTQPSVWLDKFFVVSLPNGAPLLAESTLVKASNTNEHWVWANDVLYPVASNTASDWGLIPNYSSTDDTFKQLTISPTTLGQRAKSQGGQHYFLNSGSKVSLTAGNMTTLGLATSDFQQMTNEVLALFPSKALTSLIQQSGTFAVYETRGNELYHVYGREEFKKNGYDWQNLTILSANSMSIYVNNGKTILVNGRLVRQEGQPEVYVIDGSLQKRHIPSREILNQFGFNIHNVASLRTAGAQEYTTIDPLTRYVQYSDGSRWLVDTDRRWKMLPDALPTFGVQESDFIAISSEIIHSLSYPGQITNLLQSPTTKRIFRIENGTKRWFTSRGAFERSGAKWNNVRVLSDDFINRIPDGTALN